jgi:hypothetical protein
MTSLLDESAKGVYIIAATPFTDAGALDPESTDRMVDFYLAAGVDGLTILGVMGEAPKLSLEESVAFTARVASRVDGRVPIIVGASAAGIDPMRELTRRVMDVGAAGVMISPMAGLKTDEAVEGYLPLSRRRWRHADRAAGLPAARASPVDCAIDKLFGRFPTPPKHETGRACQAYAAARERAARARRRTPCWSAAAPRRSRLGAVAPAPVSLSGCWSRSATCSSRRRRHGGCLPYLPLIRYEAAAGDRP